MVIRHLKGDIKTFRQEADQDREFIKKLKNDVASSKSGDKDKKKRKPAKRSAFKRTKRIPKTAAAQSKIERVMKEFKSGELHSGSKRGPKVTNRKQAIAIAISESRRKKRK